MSCDLDWIKRREKLEAKLCTCYVCWYWPESHHQLLEECKYEERIYRGHRAADTAGKAGRLEKVKLQGDCISGD